MNDADPARSRLNRDSLMRRVIGCAIEVHRSLGPGLLESTCARCLAYGLLEGAIPFRKQVAVPIVYKRVHFDCGYRLDLIIDERIIIEIKCVERLIKMHRAQDLTYMRLMHVSEGFVLNFNTPRLVDGISRVTLPLQFPASS